MDKKQASHLEQLKKIFKEAEVPFKERTYEKVVQVGVKTRRIMDMDDNFTGDTVDWPVTESYFLPMITIGESDYSAYTVLKFDDQGKLVDMGCYE